MLVKSALSVTRNELRDFAMSSPRIDHVVPGEGIDKSTEAKARVAMQLIEHLNV